MNELSVAERLARRSRAVTLAALATLTLLAWAWLLSGAGMKLAMPMTGMTHPATTWDAAYFALIAAMWWMMMIAMMVPSAAPLVLLYGRVHRHRGTSPPTAAFLAGYLACWLTFALAAALLQLRLERAAMASPMTMKLLSREAAALLLVAAGLYQLSPLKDACLAKCRTPVEFLTRHYRPGASGAARMGLIHGAFCIGCCWLLMALLFVGGVMNLAWIALLTLLVAAEKLLPAGEWIARIAGIVMIGWGIALLAA